MLLYPNGCTDIVLGSFDDVFGTPFVAQHVPRQPADNLVQIQRWLDACISKHVRCNNWCSRLETKGYRPTRVLELSDTGIRLRCDVQDICDFKYLALSHMWGKDASKQLRLMSSKLQDFQEAIPLDMLPNIFAEAIRITRYLNFKYLWIDSLCIIQDSKSDWTAEANMMSAVYNNAVCTIAFVLPPDAGYDSTQRRGDPRASTPCIIPESTRSGRGLIVNPSVPDRLRNRQSTGSIYKDWPLCSRAWTLQEQVLNPRTVFWEDRTIKWECVETFCDELTGEVGENHGDHPNSRSDKTLLSAQRIDEPNETSSTRSQIEKDIIFHETLDNWAALISRYRSRDLTQASDRIMAFVGIAKAFKAEHGLTYLAGMWKEHLPQSLLWSITNKENNTTTSSLLPQEPILESAPTWSFFASSIYSNRLNRNEHLGTGWFDLSMSSILFTATLLHFAWPNAPVNCSLPTAYYNFAGLQITLEFLTIDVSLPRDQELSDGEFHCISLEAQLGSLLGISKIRRASVQFYFDDYGSFNQNSIEVRIAIAEEGWNSGLYDFRGLILEPAAEKNTWKRLGYCRALANPRRWLVKTPPWIESSRLGLIKDFIFLRLEGAKTETLTLV
jgi:hypothetical protein